METNYPNLLSPYRVGQVLFKNRMLAGPLGFCVPNSGGCIHEHNLEFYEIQATGGAARVTTNDYPVSGGMGPGGGLDFREPVDIEMEKSIQEYVRTMHRHHTLAFIEFTHGGFPYGTMWTLTKKLPLPICAPWVRATERWQCRQ